ncbi:Glucose-induced degradation protein 4 homolog [Geodia barretti]|uniref:Glucose-induced degradation protein 4 homolog n=1 Tax=Geodia barretti TaxID=519541 RepID=A0AA35WA76_GEOBA|nr:Glucose-induced degradation protein 4 homolog [Geodia barretti]
MPGLLVLGERGVGEGVGRQSGCPLTLLHSGSVFRGHQQSKGSKYQVEVVFQHVDYENSCVFGYLKIQGLTEDYPNLTTFFEGDVSAVAYPFASLCQVGRLGGGGQETLGEVFSVQTVHEDLQHRRLLL